VWVHLDAQNRDELTRLNGLPTEQAAPETIAPTGRWLFLEAFDHRSMLLRPRAIPVDSTTFTLEAFAKRGLCSLR